MPIVFLPFIHAFHNFGFQLVDSLFVDDTCVGVLVDLYEHLVEWLLMVQVLPQELMIESQNLFSDLALHAVD